MVKLFFIIALLVLVSLSCKKAEDRSCFKSIGEKSSLDSSMQAYDTLMLYDDINYVIVPDTEFKVKVEGGENLIKHIKMVNKNSTLSITNENKCNFLRKLDEKVTVFIHGNGINFVYYEGSESLISKDTLFANELRLFIRDGVGDVDLTIENGYTSAVISHGWGNFTLRGKTSSAFLNCSTNSTCDTRGLMVNNQLNVNSNTQGDMYVNADVELFHCMIHQKGNIYYEGTPSQTSFEYYHEGDIIDLNN